MNAWVHTYTKPQTSSTRSCGLGRQIHESVEDTKLSTNKQHTLSFRGRSGCMRGAGAFGPFLRAGCAGAEWVRGGSLGSGMRAGRRCLAPQVGSVLRCSGGLLSSDTDTRARCVDGHVAGWATLCLPAVLGRTCVYAWAGAESGGYFGAFALVAIWGVPRLLHAGRILCRMVHINAYSQDSQEFGASAGAY